MPIGQFSGGDLLVFETTIPQSAIDPVNPWSYDLDEFKNNEFAYIPVAVSAYNPGDPFTNVIDLSLFIDSDPDYWGRWKRNAPSDINKGNAVNLSSWDKAPVIAPKSTFTISATGWPGGSEGLVIRIYYYICPASGL